MPVRLPKAALEQPMTVCIAAICRWSPDSLWVVGASDRMLSAPDIKFEPPQQKIYVFHDKAIALVAGDPYVQISICDETMRVLQIRPRKTIREVAEVYAEAYSAQRRKNAESIHLKPLGLDANALMDRSQDFNSRNVQSLIADMQRERLEADTIIAGIDDTGPHLFVVSDPGVVACADSVAFASIGSGKSHADSYFMLAHHTRNQPFHQALLDTYIAKRRAEVSPTVGAATDLFYIGPTGFQPLEGRVIAELEAIKQRLDERVAVASAAAEREALEFMIEYAKPSGAAQAVAPPVPPQAQQTAKAPADKRRRKRS